MEYTLRLPAMAGDAIPLFIVADAMARSDATGRGTLALHGPTLKERRPTRNAQLVAAAKNGTLIVCDAEGVTTSAGALIHAAGFPADSLTVGSSVKVHPFTEIDALFVRSKHLNDWSQKDGDVFHIVDMPVQVVEFGPKDERGEFAFRGMVSLPGADDTQPQAGNDAPVGKTPEWETLARVKALEIIKRDQAKDLYPSQSNIADEIAKEFRNAKPQIVGTAGKPLTGAYIKRHALKGVSSEQGRQLSTNHRRGK